MPKRYAVLTGDIAASRTFKPTQLVASLNELKEGVYRFAESFPGAFIGEIAFYRGDAWQLLLHRPELALRCTVFLRAWLYGKCKMETKIGIAIGGAEMIDRGNITCSIGEVFVQSGAMLNEIEATRRHRSYMKFAVAEHVAPFLATTVVLLDAVIRDWTQLEARTVALTILGATQAQIAKMDHVRQQSIGKRLRVSHWAQVDQSLKVFEQFSDKKQLRKKWR